MSDDESESGARRHGVLLTLVLLLALGLRGLELSDPWAGEGFKSAFGAFAAGAHARGLAQHGLAETGGLPFYWRLEYADGSVEHDLYTHHPAFYALVSAASLKLFGMVEWALRLPWVLASLLAIVSLERWMRLVWGRRVALLGALLLAVVPLSSWWGTLVWVDGLLVALYGRVLERWVRWLRSGDQVHLRAAALWFFLGGLVDWPMAFLLPGLLLQGAARLWRRGGVRACLPLGLLPLATLLSVGVHRLHMALAVHSERVQSDTENTLSSVMSLPVPLATFLGYQLDYALLYLTEAVFVLVVLGLARALWRLARGRLTAEQGLALVALPPGLLYVALFPSRSVNHSFFLFISLPAFAALSASLLVDMAGWLRARSAGAARVLGPLALALLVGLCVWRHVQSWRLEHDTKMLDTVQAEWLAPVLADERAVILGAPSTHIGVHFYSAAPILGKLESVPQLLHLRRERLSRLGPGRRVVFLFDLRLMLVFPELYAYLDAEAPSEQHLERKDQGYAFELFDLTDWVGRTAEVPR